MATLTIPPSGTDKTISASNTVVKVGDGPGQITITGNNDTIVGGNGGNTITLEGSTSLLQGGNGNDVLIAHGNNDTLVGGNGNDILMAEGNNNELLGGNGNDYLSGIGTGNVLEGGAGNDTLVYNGGALEIDGGSGFNTLLVTSKQSSPINFLDDHKGHGLEMKNLHMVDLSGQGLAHFTGFGNTVNLTDEGIKDLVGGGKNLVTGTKDTLIILAGQTDVINMGSGWKNTTPLTQKTLLAPETLIGSAGQLIVKTVTIEHYHVYTQDGVTLIISDRAPLATTAMTTATEDAPLNLDLKAFVQDPDGDAFTFTPLTLTFASGATATLSATGQVVYNLNPAVVQHLAQGDSLTDTFSYTVTDSLGVSSTGSAVITLKGANDGPIALSSTLSPLTTTENATFSLKSILLANIKDIDDHHTVRIASVSGDPHVTLTAAGDVIFTPGTDFDHLAQGDTQTVVFTYVAQDEFGATTSPVNGSIVVTGTNDAPVAVLDSLDAGGTTENTPLDMTAALLANISDADDHHTLTIVSVSGDPHVSLVNGQVVFQPGSDFDHLAQGDTQTVAFTYVVKDEFGALTPPITGSLVVTGTNDAPVAALSPLPPLGATENTFVDMTATLLAQVKDVDDHHTLSIASLVSGSRVILVNDRAVFDPRTSFDFLAAGEKRSIIFNYTVQDELGARTAPITGAFVVLGTNDAPVASLRTLSPMEPMEDNPLDITATLLANIKDVDNNHKLSIASVVGDPHVSLVNGQVVFTPGKDFDHLSEGHTQTITFTYTAQDEFGAKAASVAGSIVVRGVNDAPVVAAINPAPFHEDEGGLAINLNTVLIIKDVDISDAPTITGVTLQGSPDHPVVYAFDGSVLTLEAGQFESLGAGEKLELTFTATVDDGHGGVVTQDFVVTIVGQNDAPVVTAVNPAPFHEDAAALVIDMSAVLTITDVDASDAPTITGVTLQGSPDHPVVYAFDSGLLTLGAGQFESLGAGEKLELTFTATVDDGHGGVVAQDFVVTIVGQNDAPVVTAVNPAPFHEDAAALVVDMNTILTITDVDASDAPTITSVTLQGSPDHPVVYAFDGGLLTLGAGQFESLAEGQTLDLTFTATVDDGHGGVVAQDFVVTIAGQNDAPVRISSALPLFGTDENGTLSIPSSLLLAQARDVDASSHLSISLVDGQNLSLDGFGNLIFNAGTDYDFLSQGEVTFHHFQYVVEDEHGARTDPISGTIQISGHADAPTAINLVYPIHVSEDNLQDITELLLSNIQDVDHNDTLSIRSILGDSHVSFQEGRVVFNPGSDFNHLAAGQTQEIMIQYMAQDNLSITTPLITTPILVEGHNDVPTVEVKDHPFLLEDEVYRGIDVKNVLSISDVDDGDQPTITEVISQNPSITYTFSKDGFLSIHWGQFESLGEGQTLDLTFTATVDDGHGGVVDQNFIVTIQGQNDRPVNLSVSLPPQETGENDILTIPASLLLAQATDIDALSHLSISSVSGPYTSLDDSGNIVFNPGTTYDFLNEGQTRDVLFFYWVQDEHGAKSNPIVGRIYITGANDAPNAVDLTLEPIQVGENDIRDLTLLLRENVWDIDSPDVTVKSLAGSSSLSLIDGHVVFDPQSRFDPLSAGETQVVNFQYRAQDDKGLTTPLISGSLIVQGENDAPVVTARDAQILRENMPLSLDVSDVLDIRDIDRLDEPTITGVVFKEADRDAYDVIKASFSNNILTLQGSQFDALTPNQLLHLTFTGTVDDHQGGVVEQDFVVTIRGENDAPVVTVQNPLPLFENQSAFSIDVTNILSIEDKDQGDSTALTNVVFKGADRDAYDAITTSFSNNILTIQPGQFEALAQDQSLHLTFTARVEDDYGGVVNQDFILTINGQNDAPTGPTSKISLGTVNGGQSLDLTNKLLSYISDIDNPHTLSIQSVWGDADVTLDSAGHVIFDKNLNFKSLATGSTQTVNFSYTVHDEFGAVTTDINASLIVNGTFGSSGGSGGPGRDGPPPKDIEIAFP